MRIKKLLNHLEKEVYCELKPSVLSGIGVFALKDIPQGTNPFKEKDTKYIPVKEDYIERLDTNVKEHIKKLFVYSNGNYFLPENGIQTLCITHYLNHSDNPNIFTNKNCDIFIAMRDIGRGEELTVNYNLFDDAKEYFRR